MAERFAKPYLVSKATHKTAHASEETMEWLSNQLLCSVCLKDYCKPRVLPCLHVFCEACLEKMMETETDKLSAPCPKCCKSIPLPQESMSSLPAAFYIQHLFEIRAILKKVHSSNKMPCDKCGEGELKGYCQDCGQFVCQLCLDIHHKWKELQSHEISSLDEVEKTASKMVTPKKLITLCSKHPTEPIKIYCETCEELICRDCTVKTHHNHNYDLITDTFPKHRDAILAYLYPVKAELTRVAETHTKLKSRLSRLDWRAVSAKAKVDSEVCKLQATIEARRRDLHLEIDCKVCQEKKELQAHMDQHELKQAQLSSCVEFVEGSLQSGSQEEVLSMKGQVEQRLQQMAHEFNQLELCREKVFHVDCADLCPACQTLGEVRLEQVHIGGTHVKTIDGIKSPRHIAFAVTGEMVVCEWGANCVTVFDSRYRHLRSFGNTGPEENRLDTPLGVAISCDNTVFVADRHCVRKFTLEGQFIASVGSLGSGKLQLQYPWAIAYNGTNNRVYVCDTHNHRITILNHDLTFHGSFGSKGSEAGQFDKPVGISVDSRGNVLVAEYGNKRIQVFDESGLHLSTITHTIPKQQLQQPYSVSVGPDDCVYVVECDANRVSVFDDNGKYIKSFGKRGNKDGEFVNPYAIAVADGYVYVSDTDNHRIQVFKM